VSSHKRRYPENFHNDRIIITQVFARHSQNTFTRLSYKRVDESPQKHCATKFGSCLVLGVLTVGLYSWWLSKPPKRPLFRSKNSFGVGRIFFYEKWAFSMRKGTKKFNSTGTKPTQGFCLQLFWGCRWDPPNSKNVLYEQFGLKLDICGSFKCHFFLKFYNFYRLFFYQNRWKVRRTMTANGKKITMHGLTLNPFMPRTITSMSMEVLASCKKSTSR